jgi:hypothetical protein
MAAANIIQGQLRELSRRNLCEIIGNAPVLSLEHLKTSLMQAGQSAFADATDHDGINSLPGESFERLASTMAMPLIAVALFLDFTGFFIDQ